MVVQNARTCQSRPLFETVEDGVRVDDVLQWFPGVTRERAANSDPTLPG
jgi:hypothetical protein